LLLFEIQKSIFSFLGCFKIDFESNEIALWCMLILKKMSYYAEATETWLNDSRDGGTAVCPPSPYSCVPLHLLLIYVSQSTALGDSSAVLPTFVWTDWPGDWIMGKYTGVKE